LDYAGQRDEAYVDAVEEEIETFFSERSAIDEQRPPDAFLEQLSGLVPDATYQRIRVLYEATRDYAPTDGTSRHGGSRPEIDPHPGNQSH